MTGVQTCALPILDESSQTETRKAPEKSKMQEEMELFKMQMAYIDSLQNPRPRNSVKKMSQKYRCRQSLSGKKTFLTVFCFRTYSDLPAFEGHPDPHLSVNQRQHIHRQSADGCFGRRRCKRPPLFADRRSDG